MFQSTTIKAGFKLAAPRSTKFEWSIGFLLGVPISIPSPPLYWFALLSFFAVLLRSRPKPIHSGVGREVIVILLISLALLSSIFGLIKYDLDTVRIITTSFFFLFLLAARFIHNKRAILEGFCCAMLMWAVMILPMAVYLQIFENGLLLFSVPDFRLWGQDFFPDWPNYIAFMLSLAFLLNAFVFKRPLTATIQIIAAILTTSRTPFIALGFFFTTSALLWLSAYRRRWILILLGITALVCLTLPSMALLEIDSNFLDRLLVFEDREDIYSFGLNLLAQSPYLGHGAILLDESIGFFGHPSFHNSYLDVSVRHGIFALLLFLALIIPTRTNLRQGGLKFLCVVMFVLIGSVFQNFLKHPHIILIYVIFIEAGAVFNDPVKRR